jgi:colanic acid biosynthesis glycosyl transferase WcaI
VNLVVVTPHFAPDVAPTGAVITRIVEELAHRGHRMEVLTALPWYRDHRIEPGYEGKLIRHEDTPWGRVTRLHPFPTADKRNIVRRAMSFAGFSTVGAVAGSRGGRVDGVLAVSPPLTLGLTGLAVARARKAPFVFNLQDVFPDVAIDLGVLTGRRGIAAARRLERFCYRHADAVTVLSEDLKDNVTSRVDDPAKVRVIPNFVDTERIRPHETENAYRREFGLEGKIVVMYAGNVGLSQSVESIIEAASALSYEEDLMFVINGQGARRDEIERRAAGMSNVRFVDLQPVERLPEVLAAGDIHVVPLKRGLARSSVPSKTYSILAASRPLIASVDEGSEVARVVERAEAGIAVPPEDPEALTKAIRALLDSPEVMRRMGASGRSFVEGWASPAAVAENYEALFEELLARRGER